MAPTELLIGVEEGEGLDLWASLRSAWKRETKYRAHVGQGLKDRTGRPLTTERQVEFSFAAGAVISSSPIDSRYPPDYESYRAAANTLGGRFPGGQTSLFQGLWTDPVTGLSYARARWYDARTASWLSEDPLLDVDSPNLYAFVGWGPHAAVDPTGELLLETFCYFNPRFCAGAAEGGYEVAKGIVTAPVRAFQADAKAKAERLAAYGPGRGGYQEYQQKPWRPRKLNLATLKHMRWHSLVAGTVSVILRVCGTEVSKSWQSQFPIQLRRCDLTYRDDPPEGRL